MAPVRRTAVYDRSLEPRRAAALAGHAASLRDSQTPRSPRCGRSAATSKAYFYDPSDDNKRPSDSPQERQFWALDGHARTSICKQSSAVAATARGRRARLPDSSGCGSLERRYSGPRYCPSFVETSSECLLAGGSVLADSAPPDSWLHGALPGQTVAMQRGAPREARCARAWRTRPWGASLVGNRDDRDASIRTVGWASRRGRLAAGGGARVVSWI